jgi:ribose 1,5-bisphosphate isomerase
MDREVKQVIDDIKSLKIQGARNVAKAAINALGKAAKKSKAKSYGSFYKDIDLAADALSISRPTEPMMRSLLNEEMEFLRKLKSEKFEKIANMFLAHQKETVKRMDVDAKNLAEYGAKLIPDGANILTHCHSSTTTQILIHAKKMKKKFSVVAFETRPRYQGRKTATELANAGIDTTLVVDGAMHLFMKKADIVIVGADSITSRGDLINKIGTATLAHIAKSNDVSFYSATELAKYSPMTIFGTREKIEERDHKEIWENAPKKVKIRNPAFEATAAKYINGYITELGVIPPQSFFAVATQKLGIKLYE